MSLINWLKPWILLGSAALLLSACGGGDDPAPPPKPEPTLVDVAKADARFSILVEAVVAADLATTLSGAGPFTVFAPTNDAFAALLTELGVSKEQLLANKDLLKTVLTYHVLPARVAKATVPAGKAITTVQGGIFKVDAVGNDLVITDGRNRKANITATDVAGSNGLIHVIDKVILPANKNLVETAIATPDLSILVEAVVAADLGATLSGTGPFTVFAPTNAAFAALLTELGVTKAQLLANKPLLTKVLTYHVLSGRVLKADVPIGTAVNTVQGESLTVDANLDITDRNGRKARITATDVMTSNGVVHLIDKVILPKQ
ncbi:fasciclin domain-containing protein [Paucibacter sp. DJ1R-11]|uniref:fasciclin domain-containing protein n=1 Tax=Paucibacter sp. DJ1R-11 TaxID=2893556 RepID=UPI0021E44790|nr:fasciclin domain-containing protein [Paucibacter sp. DJ1R-11]MCV2364847.1 fasciclin domain-containing protein [Paucibacter sp. DJ1R-11]